MKKEILFKLSSLSLLMVLFISAKAVADRADRADKITQKIPTKTSNIFANLSLVDEANMINSGALNASRLTAVGNQTENIATLSGPSK